MRSSALKFILLASLALNISVIAAAGYFYNKQSEYWISPFGKKMERNRFIFEELSLGPEHLKEMKTRAMQFRSEIDRRRHEITQKRKELITLIRSDTPDIKSINAAISGISGMQGDMQRQIALHILEEKALLDKSQQKKFLDLIENAMTQGRQAGCPSSIAHE